MRTLSDKAIALLEAYNNPRESDPNASGDLAITLTDTDGMWTATGVDGRSFSMCSGTGEPKPTLSEALESLDDHWV